MVASMDDVPAAAAAERASLLAKKPRRVASLLIDNYDSYTYNISQMLAQVNGSPSSVVVIRNDDFGGQFSAAWDHFVAQSRIAAGQGADLELNVVISPGPGHPAEPKDFGMCADAIRHAAVPVLGVCLGHQGMAQVYGGQVVEAKEVMHGRTSRVFFQESDKSLFAHVPNGFEVVRYHSLVIDPENVPEELEVTAQTDDGVIMAVQHRTKQQFGVQFHPEAVCSEFGYQLFQNFRDVTLGQCASKCELHHSNHPEQNTKTLSQQRVQGSIDQSSAESSCRVLVERVSSGLASLDFAEFVFGELFGASKRSFWLDSSNHDTVAGSDAAIQSRCSMMGDDSGPLSYCVEYDVAKVELRIRRHQTKDDDEKVDIYPGQDILDHVREVMQAHRCHEIVFKNGEHEERSSIELPFAFRGGFVGYFGYEVLGSEQEGKKQFNDKFDVKGERAPDASFVFADRTLVFDHRDGVIYSLSVSENKDDSKRASQQWHESMRNQLQQLTKAFNQKSTARSSLPPNSKAGTDEVIFRPSRSRGQYVADIEEIQRLIRAGETYEVCLTNHLRAEYALRDPLAFYRMLRRRNPAPFAGFYLSNPKNRFQAPEHVKGSGESAALEDTYALCCSSPERFLKVGADGWMESKPIKGTRPRGRDPKDDAAIAEELASCEKDRAENMMIADLVRNDFGVVARVGSVHVPRLMGVETYATVHQLVTTVRAQRREDADVVDVLRATFPGGSMTGAPKKRTMHIIRELERAPRGVYSGGLGFLSIDGSCDLNIIIRTAIVTPNSVTLGAGGAIVALSDSDDEYDEMLLKARALVATIGAYATGSDNGSGARVVVN
ncbi:aminodeoxychorismate synthase [Phytophthora cinnamomi]|uniref:aminodeoxychorismate synthase n=1 Tax=Phytophthora cinnamomi TaxID=4785 RepID=UPI0035595AAB|nr:aminodeoxychorismate synthase [Phytophthora cinnamomi]